MFLLFSITFLIMIWIFRTSRTLDMLPGGSWRRIVVSLVSLLATRGWYKSLIGGSSALCWLILRWYFRRSSFSEVEIVPLLNALFVYMCHTYSGTRITLKAEVLCRLWALSRPAVSNSTAESRESKSLLLHAFKYVLTLCYTWNTVWGFGCVDEALQFFVGVKIINK